MAQPVDFVPIRLTRADERSGRRRMREMLGRNWWRLRGRASWAGFAAEKALCRAINAGGKLRATASPSLSYDLLLHALTKQSTMGMVRVEVKTRAVDRGYTDPRRFQPWVVVPTHDGREPIKEDVATVMFCWYSMADPRRIWALGQVRGPEEFKRRAVFYREGEPLPRGGWAKAGGAWAIETKQLRPFPRGLFQEHTP